MGRIKRGGYIIQFWIGDHDPKHVHVYQDNQFIAKIQIEPSIDVLDGKMGKKLRKVIEELIKEGSL